MEAPTFTLKNSQGEDIDLPETGTVVLYFYPKADTPGCTLEGKTFKELYPKFVEKGAMIWGVSPDSVEDVKKFKEKYGFPFTLLADNDHEVAEAYGVWGTKKNFGKEYEGITRTTFLIKEGEIVEQWTHKPGETEEEVLAAI